VFLTPEGGLSFGLTQIGVNCIKDSGDNKQSRPFMGGFCFSIKVFKVFSVNLSVTKWNEEQGKQEKSPKWEKISSEGLFSTFDEVIRPFLFSL